MVVNKDINVVEDFGREWSLYDQSALDLKELQCLFEEYFEIFPWAILPVNAQGFDLGCGSGRYSRCVAQKVGHLHCIDASEAALTVAKNNLKGFYNCSYYNASVDKIPLLDESMDFGYSLGVLHHVPDTQAGLNDCVRKLKIGAPFLVYLYYTFDNRPWWFRLIWWISDLLRKVICRLPFNLKRTVCKIIAIFIYFPLARINLMLEKLGVSVHDIPLAAYRKLSFYTMCTDALDRFGTKVEHRYTREQVAQMMSNAGLERVVFSTKIFWAAMGFKRYPHFTKRGTDIDCR